ncbi:PssD/Cps14F family polysaccharide biosynthesis glycosyltransferase [Patescibacteria group bacterium]
MKTSKNRKIALISSPGGHLFKTLKLKKWWGNYERFWVTDIKKNENIKSLRGEKVYGGYFPENRNVMNFIRNLLLAYRVLRKEKPDLIFSIGAGIAPPFFLIGRIMGIKTVFMETFNFIPKSTLSGRLIYPICSSFIVQNKEILQIYPKAKFVGRVL